jgi:hypothetical protein
LRADERQPFGDRRQPSARLRRQCRARAHEAGVVAIERAGLLRIEACAAALRNQRSDAAEQPAVLENVAVMARQERRHFEVDRLKSVIRMRPGQQVERRRHLIEVVPAPLQCADRIVEIRCIGCACDCLDRGFMLAQDVKKSRTEVLRRYGFERWQTKGRVPSGQ